MSAPPPLTPEVKRWLSEVAKSLEQPEDGPDGKAYAQGWNDALGTFSERFLEGERTEEPAQPAFVGKFGSIEQDGAFRPIDGGRHDLAGKG